MKFAKPPLREFLDRESSGGAIIVIFASLGLLVANSPFSESYFSFLSFDFKIGQGSLGLELTVQKTINYVLMTFFFFVVGLEIKRELTSGHLASLKKALMPFIAALGGIALPALIYLAIAGRVEASGWGVPVATDIALAVGLLTLIGSRVPESLKVFLLALAVIDDIGAILIIAFVYSNGLKIYWILLTLLVILLIILMKKLNIKATIFYIFVGAILWYTIYKSGVHPTLAGVILGLLTPNIKRMDDESETVIEWLEDKFHPLSTFLIVPLFAFANTGVVVNVDSLSRASQSLVAWGIFFGLIIGKPVGILISSVLASKLKLADLPSGARKSTVMATGNAAGIGFTVAIFIAHIAFTDRQTEEVAIISVIIASIFSAFISWLMFRFFSDRTISTNKGDN